MSATHPSDADPARLRAWLLGRLPEADAERLESAMLESDELFEEIGAAENDLFDELAAGRLSEADREAFLARHRTGADRRRLSFARALGNRAAAPNVIRTSRFTRNSLLATAAVLVIALTAVLLRPGADGPSVATGTIAEVVPPPVDPSPAPPPPASEPIRAPLLRTVEVTIVLGALRSEADRAAIEVPLDAGSVALRVELDPADVYDRYGVQLRGPDGAVVFERSDLEAEMHGGVRALRAEVPAGDLSSGSYELAVAGTTDGETEDLGFQTVTVVVREK